MSEAEPPGHRDPDEAPIDLLVVEDDTSVVGAVTRMLDRSETQEFRITAIGRVEEALELLQEQNFDAMLLDLSLPDGMGLQSMLRAKVAAAALPIVVMTTKSNESQGVAAVRAGAQDYLVKGEWNAQLLVRTLLHAIERHRIFDELLETKRQQHYLATHDRLTGLPNREAFHEALSRAIALAQRSGTQLAVLFLDLDRFKLINDTLGHPVGDALLKVIAQRLAKVSRKSDFAARLGGDEFILLAQNARKEHSAAKVAEVILEQLREPLELEGTEQWVTPSIGIAVYPDDGTEADVLVRNADAAMYGAKEKGGDRFQFASESTNQRISRRLALENSLRGGLQRDEFRLHYQPFFEAGERTPRGAEALVRWRNPQGEIVPPANFIPVAEESTLIISLGEWVLRHACEFWASRRRGTAGSRVSINLSSLQLRSRGMAGSIATILEESGMDPARLELEVTETAVKRGEDQALVTLQQVREMGISTALDDFGTGYSSLSRLRELPFDRLKIDRAFVTGIPADRQATALVSAIIQMAHSLEMEVVAEGVETEEQAGFLEDNGCDQLQGFLLARPLDPAALEAEFPEA